MLHFGFLLIILFKITNVLSTNDDIQLEKPDGLVLLNEENFERRIYQGGISKAGFDYFVKFYANGSPINMDSDWNKLAKKFKNSRDVKIAQFECKAEQRSTFCKDRNIPVGANGSPTLIYYRNGIPLDIHTGTKDLKTLQDFVDSMIEGKDEF